MGTEFTNADLKALIEANGSDLLRSIRSTAFTILVNQPGVKRGVKYEDIEFVKSGDTDLIKVRMWNPRSESYYYHFYLTKQVEDVVFASNTNDYIEPTLLQI